jgi:ankyrin repeat protein
LNGYVYDDDDIENPFPAALAYMKAINQARKTTDDGPVTIVDMKMEYTSRFDYSRRVPLHYAACTNNWDLVALILFHGADVDASFVGPRTPPRLMISDVYFRKRPEYGETWVDTYADEHTRILGRYVRHFAFEESSEHDKYLEGSTALYHEASID